MSTDSELPRSGGMFAAVTGLVTPLHITARTPTMEALPYTEPRPGIAPLADVYLPSSDGPHPSVVLVHGGGFVIGSRSMKPMRLLATRFAQAGIASAVIDYRMILRGGRLEEAVTDVAAAFRWWQRTAKTLHCDPQRISLMGLSAGATLTQLAAARVSKLGLHRVVGVFGVADFADLRGRRAQLMRRMVLGDEDSERVVARSPISVQGEIPQPMLLLHGTADVMVDVAQTRKLAARRAELELPTQTCYLNGAPHGFFNTAATSEAADRALETIIPFLRG